MKILHTSDWHLGQHFYGKSRANEHLQFLNWLLEQVTEHSVDAIILAGDIFDTSAPPSYARELYFNFIDKLNTLGCQLIALAGNHDSVAMLNESKQLLAALNTQVITTASADSDQQLVTIKNASGKALGVVCAIPFLRPRDLVTSQAGQSATDKQLQLQVAITEHYQTLYESANAYQLPVIMTGHLTTVGSKTSDSVREIYIGTLEAFPANAFPKADYIALGHIHRPQKVAGNNTIRYSGSPIPLSFDEASHDKTVNLVSVNDQSTVVVEALTIPRFQPMAMLKTSVDELATSIEQLAQEYSEQITTDLPLWLDIEISAQGYLADLSGRVQELVKDLPIEVLLIRRSKQERQQILAEQRTVTLEELSVSDVFTARLAQEEWQTDEQEKQKERLTELFKQVHQQVLAETNANHVESNAVGKA
ncbi:exonuclease subunit SbcD [Thalassotalea montiporae]